MTTVAVRPDQARALPAKVMYAKTLADSGLLPAAYRQHPPNILYALEYGEMLGLSPMAAITGIHIIEGKPSASAGLISALVRRAGHRLRVTGDDKTATAQIVRADDPDFTFSATWTMDRAKAADLTGKATWRKYPAAMLKARALTEVARDACEEALFGLHYTPEELGAEVDEDGEVVGEIAGDPAPSAPRRRTAPTAVDSLWQTPAQAAEVDQEWLDEALELAAAFTDDAVRDQLWRDTAGKHRAGGITGEDRKRIEAIITTRNEDLAAADVVEGVVVPDLEPEDPWLAKVEAIAATDEADAAAREVRDSYAAGDLDETRANRILTAITKKTTAVKEAAR